MLERRNPLPRGVYWVNVPADGHPTEPMTVSPFNQWVKESGVKVRSSVDESAATGFVWYLFETVQPTNWQGPGFPNVAEKGVETKHEDTYDAPIVEYPLDRLTTWLGGRGPGQALAKVGVGLAKLGVGVALFAIGAAYLAGKRS